MDFTRHDRSVSGFVIVFQSNRRKKSKTSNHRIHHVEAPRISRHDLGRDGYSLVQHRAFDATDCTHGTADPACIAE